MNMQPLSGTVQSLIDGHHSLPAETGHDSHHIAGEARSHRRTGQGRSDFEWWGWC